MHVQIAPLVTFLSEEKQELTSDLQIWTDSQEEERVGRPANIYIQIAVPSNLIQCSFHAHLSRQMFWISWNR